MKWQTRDVVAILVIIVAASLLHRGIDTVVGWTLVAIVAGYFGISVPSLIRIVRNGKQKEDR